MSGWQLQRRPLTDGERDLLVQSLLNEESRLHLEQINTDILATVEGGSDKTRQEVVARLGEAATELHTKRKALRNLAALISRKRLQFCGPIIIPEQA